MPIELTEEEEWYFIEGLDDFKRQIREYGYYDSDHDDDYIGTEDTVNYGAFVSERRWGPVGKGYVPSRLWDQGTPMTVMF